MKQEMNKYTKEMCKGDTSEKVMDIIKAAFAMGVAVLLFGLLSAYMLGYSNIKSLVKLLFVTGALIGIVTTALTSWAISKYCKKMEAIY